MSRPRTTPLARDDSPAAMMAAGVPGEDDDLDALSSSARVAKHRRRAPGRTSKEPVVKHRPAPPTGRQVEPQCPTDASGAWPALRMPVLPLLDRGRERKRAIAKGPVELPATQTLGKRLESGLTVADFLSRLPDRLAASDLRTAADAIAKARLGGRGVALGMGARPIEAGLSPLIVDLMERGVITAVALDGAAVTRDFALAGGTSETLGRLAREAASVDEGLGLALGRHVAAGRSPSRASSIAAAGARLGIPVTAPSATPAPGTSDFQRLAAVVARLGNGVLVSLGADVLHDVFDAAFDLARSLGHAARPLLMIDLGVARPPASSDAPKRTARAGGALHLDGPQELLFPLLAAAVLERIAASKRRTR